MWTDIITQIIPHLAGILAVVATVLLARYLQITVDKARLQKVIAYILDLIVRIEEYEEDGVLKKEIVVETLNEIIDNKNKKLLNRVFGNLENAVEWIFQTIAQPNIISRTIAKLLLKN